MKNCRNIYKLIRCNKTKMKKVIKYSAVLISILILLIIPFASAGFSDFVNKLTGKATSTPVTISIEVGAGSVPTIPAVLNSTNMTDVSSAGTTEGPSNTSITLNFTAYDANGFGNLDISSAIVNYTNGGTTRTSDSCALIENFDVYYANITCITSLWWWDTTGTWDIGVHIKDLNDNAIANNTATFSVGTTAGSSFSPTTLTWSTLAAGVSDQEPNENFLINNTGNLARSLELNATDLIGESNAAEALWANNFTGKISSGCEGTAMVTKVFTAIASSTLPAGNYTLNDGTAQEQIYVCLESAGPELDAQLYSTTAEGAWTLRIVA